MGIDGRTKDKINAEYTRIHERTDRRYKILIVDDDTGSLNALSLLVGRIEGFSCGITLAQNSNDAIAELKKQEFDLVLSDYKMPGMDGIGLLTYVKDTYPKTVRVLITAYSDAKIAKDAINRAAVHSYVEKPWDNEDLKLTIREALNRKTERDAGVIPIDCAGDAMKTVKNIPSEAERARPGQTPKQTILAFDSTTEFNKFSYSLRKLENIYIKDVHVFENKYIVTVARHKVL